MVAHCRLRSTGTSLIGARYDRDVPERYNLTRTLVVAPVR